jgi:hypothetical protein
VSTQPAEPLLDKPSNGKGKVAVADMLTVLQVIDARLGRMESRLDTLTDSVGEIRNRQGVGDQREERHLLVAAEVDSKFGKLLETLGRIERLSGAGGR